MSGHRRGRITVQRQPVGAAGGMMRLMGVVHTVMGLVFVVVSFEILSAAGLFGLPFLVGGAFFAINGIRMAVSRNGLTHRVRYDIETQLEKDTLSGPVKGTGRSSAHTPVFSCSRTNDGSRNAKSRLQQLKDLKEAGLMEEEEYKQKRQEILKEL